MDCVHQTLVQLFLKMLSFGSKECTKELQCSPMAVGPSDISGNDWLGPINGSPAADRMSDEIFGAKFVFLAEI